MQHRGGPCRQFGRVETVEEHGHRHGRHLVVGHLSLGVGADQPIDCFGAQGAPVAFGLDQPDRREGHSWSMPTGPFGGVPSVFVAADIDLGVDYGATKGIDRSAQLHRDVHQRAVLGPGAVVVLGILVAEQFGEDEPGV